MKTRKTTDVLSNGLRRVGLAAAILVAPAGPTVAGEWSGYVSVESRTFSDDGAFAGQDNAHAGSFVLEPEYHHESTNGRDSFTLMPFLRLDSQDSERGSHGQPHRGRREQRHAADPQRERDDLEQLRVAARDQVEGGAEGVDDPTHDR